MLVGIWACPLNVARSFGANVLLIRAYNRGLILSKNKNEKTWIFRNFGAVWRLHCEKNKLFQSVWRSFSHYSSVLFENPKKEKCRDLSQIYAQILVQFSKSVTFFYDHYSDLLEDPKNDEM